MRFTLIIASLTVLVLFCIFVFLLFRTSENKKVEVEETSPSVINIEIPALSPENTSEDMDVSHPSTTRDERGLGTDINMEFPTLEE